VLFPFPVEGRSHSSRLILVLHSASSTSPSNTTALPHSPSAPPLSPLLVPTTRLPPLPLLLPHLASDHRNTHYEQWLSLTRTTLYIPSPSSVSSLSPLSPRNPLTSSLPSVDELRAEDVTLRLNALHRISTICLALGPERTRTELLAFLQESLDDDDEILLALAEELGGNFVEYLGGPEHAHLVLPILEHLAGVEETLVRDKAAQSANQVCAVLSQEQVDEHYVPLLRRLSTGEWFTSRTSATAMYAAAYPKATPAVQEDLLKMFTKLCDDDTPMARRAAAKELGGFAKQLSHDTLLNDLLPAFRKLSTDDQDSVRLLTVDAMIAIAEALNEEECKSYLGATMKALVNDRSWRVRYMVADHFVQLAKAAGQDIVREELVTAFVALLKDNEAEVRTAASGQVPGTFPSFPSPSSSSPPYPSFLPQASPSSSTAKPFSLVSCPAFATSPPTPLSTSAPLSEARSPVLLPFSARTPPSNTSSLSSSSS
jgi:hypothetical protein